jgi:transcriptional/translational regulatory protein YebC/TACO1
MQPTTVVGLETADAAKQVLRLIDALDDLDDVQQVSANFDIPDSLLQELEAV